jgi:hypothetical protein
MRVKGKNMANMYTIGTDMEVLAKAKDGHHVALCGKIGGTKTNPKQIENMQKGFCIQEDNVALEFNIPPCSNKLDFLRSVKSMRGYTRNLLKTMGLIISRDSSVLFRPDELVHPLAREFGCQPDFNAWTKMKNPPPECNERELRTVGGHVHVGTDCNYIQGTQWMDMFLGVGSVILDNTPEAQRRRKLYGRAGAMRPKPYGFEYRVLSNFWMFEDDLINWVYLSTKRAMTYPKAMAVKMAKEVQDCINNSDVAKAEKLVQQYEIQMP